MAANPDVIIVGGGTAGSIVARRLIDAGKVVHLLEAGPKDENPAIHDMSRLAELWLAEEDWGYFTTPQKHANGRKLHWPRGRVLGGSHSLNASIFVRGSSKNFDYWESLGNTGWGWKDVSRIYKKIENYRGPKSDLRGTEGLLDITKDYPKHPVQTSVLKAGHQWGMKLNEDYNGAEQEGIAQEQLNFKNGERFSTYRAYLHPIIGHPNLTVTTGAWVHRLLIEGGKAVGVEFEQAGDIHQLRGSEVALAAGALDSPRILLMSGIGPRKDLESLGIDVVADLPGVGENLHDHLLVPVIFKTTKRDVGAPPAGMPITQVHWFWKSDPTLEVSDTQPIVFSVPMMEPGMEGGPDTGFTIMGGLVSPKSRGTFKLSGKNPHDPTLQDPNILEHEDDVKSLMASVRQVREVGRQAELVDVWGAEEVFPGSVGDDDAALEQYVRNYAITYHHQVGTCKMGVDKLAVVSPRLKVHGIEGVRVIDASIMPSITTGNTNAPSMVIGEKAAEFILSGQ